MQIKTMKQALPYLFNSNVPVLIHGRHGIGKSQGVYQVSQELTYEHPKLGKRSYDFIDLRLGNMEVGDLLGLADFLYDENGNKIATKFMRPSWLPTDPDSKGILFLDEINRARRDVLQAAFQLVLEKRIHEYQLPKGWVVVGACNPNTDEYIVTDIGDAAFLDRFCHIKLTPSVAEWVDYASNSEYDSDIVDFIREQPEMLASKGEDFELDIKPSARSWEFINRLITNKTPVNLLQELAIGIVGTTTAIAFMESRRSADKPFKAEQILKEFSKIKKKVQSYADPKDNRLDILKATCDNLLRYADKRKKDLDPQERDNLLDFLKTIPNEMMFANIKDLYYKEVFQKALDGDEELKNKLLKARGKA